jgi:ribA/ribD-fused uncharacterized protein
MKHTAARLQLLAKKSLLLSGKMIPMYEQNPFKTNQKTPDDRKDKLTLRGLPFSVSDEEVVKMLTSKDVVLTSSVRDSLMRDEHGSLTSYKTGDRFVYCEPFDTPIPRRQNVCGFSCDVLHHGKDGLQCRSCNTLGHKAGDSNCTARAEEGSILGFSGYQHPLSNHFLTPIDAFDQQKPFESVEHAFYWKMASDLSKHDLAFRIMSAPHAGVVKRLSKEMDDDDRLNWENDNLDIMRDLLNIKVSTCTQFRDCLLMTKDKVLADCTFNKHWGTGLSKWVTEATRPEFWPGTNYLGVLLMELAVELLASTQSTEDANDQATGDTTEIAQIDTPSTDEEITDNDDDETRYDNTRDNSQSTTVQVQNQASRNHREKKEEQENRREREQ